MKRVCLLTALIIGVALMMFGCANEVEEPYTYEEFYTYNGEAKIDIDGRSFELEDIPENKAEETVVNNFKYSIVGDFEELSKILADIESLNVSLKNEEKQFKEGLDMQSYTIHKISTLIESEYNQEELEDGKYNPFYFYGLEEDVEMYNLIEYEVINVKFTQKHTEKSIELGPQWGDGTFSRNFLVGKSHQDGNYKIYSFGMM